ncbi:glycosyltransferase family 2 protein [Pseudomonadota bacterium]
MKISIVTISFNQAKFLERAIRSVIEQDYNDVEYIIVDPGSTDGSREIIEKYRDRISKIIFEPDKGPADGLNKGFGKAHGTIYGFLNSDDVLEPGALSSVVRYFKDNPAVDVVSGHSWIVDSDGEPIRRFYSDRYSLWMAAHGASILSQASTFFRAEVFHRAGGFNVENFVAWDGELFADMAIAGARYSRVDKFWSKFRIHEEGITGSGKLHQAYEGYYHFLFRKIMGREKNIIDRPASVVAKYVRKVANPQDTMERLFHGPIYKAAK